MNRFLSRLREPALVLGFGLSCLCLHEFGHALAGYLTGQHLTEFVVFSLVPHVRLTGRLSPAQHAFSAAAGSGLVLLVWFGWLMLSSARRLGLDVVSGFALVELLGWTLSSLWPPGRPSPDDAERFLASSGARPEGVVILCLLLAFAGGSLWRSPRFTREHRRSKTAASSRVASIL